MVAIVPYCGKREECECEIMPLTVGLKLLFFVKPEKINEI